MKNTLRQVQISLILIQWIVLKFLKKKKKNILTNLSFSHFQSSSALHAKNQHDRRGRRIHSTDWLISPLISLSSGHKAPPHVQCQQGQHGQC